MPFADDAEYQEARREAEMKAVEMLKACFGRRLEQPKTDGDGRTWIGFGRNLFRRRQSQAAADLDLSEDVAATYQVLERRLLQMTFKSPTTLMKVPSLVVIADLVGPEAIRDCEPLWAAIAAGEWTRVGAILLAFDWRAYRAAGQHSLDQEAINMRIIELSMGGRL
ncbi:hypothetical protein [Stenotrophomonas sp. SORGH_AS_0321]|uniref:hypothetical protein n=1 Tax=Stenotrophomonas sp. SORGH_AS_0321 TaxID=3041787 RepID=UPI002858E25F|nr:hypothetical protein [Stenotrophomonas sp. SORGH_AS_0321]MDR6094909.1 hypothetical protein [Stenotrophomonas sp. SORGH_AS_0321]